MIRLLTVLVTAIVTSEVNGLTNGRPAHRGDFPFIAVVCHYAWATCSGVILDARHILVRGTCIVNGSPETITVMVGRRTFTLCNHLSLAVDSFRIHPQRINDIHDIAVLKLAQSISWRPTVLPINIARVPENCETCIMTGLVWSTNANSRSSGWSSAFIYSRERCEMLGVDLGETELCFVDPTARTIITVVDNGFPIICEGAMVGLIFVSGAADLPTPPALPSMMINLQYYEDWIYNRN